MKARHDALGQTRCERRAGELQATALRLHLNAPRGGEWFNSKGQKRSAPGEVPAKEFGGLEKELNKPVVVLPDGARAAVNYGVLEFGYADNNLEPRPLGQLALEVFRATVQ